MPVFLSGRREVSQIVAQLSFVLSCLGYDTSSGSGCNRANVVRSDLGVSLHETNVSQRDVL